MKQIELEIVKSDAGNDITPNQYRGKRPKKKSAKPFKDYEWFTYTGKSIKVKSIRTKGAVRKSVKAKEFTITKGTKWGYRDRFLGKNVKNVVFEELGPETVFILSEATINSLLDDSKELKKKPK